MPRHDTAGPASLDLERLRRLAPGRDRWQLVVVHGPEWIVPTQPGAEPELPLISLCRSERTGELAMGAPGMPSRAGDPVGPLALSALADLAGSPDGGGKLGLPAVIEVTDKALHHELEAPLAELGIVVTLVDSMPALDEVIAAMRHDLGGPQATVQCLEADIPVDAITSFAEAAMAFYDAAPWNHLTDQDLLRVGTRGAPADMRHFVVMGAASIEHGIRFFSSVEEFDLLCSTPPDRLSAQLRASVLWSLTFDRAWEIPVSQYELWERHRLPRTRDERFPLLLGLSGGRVLLQVDASRLRFVEGLLRAVTATAEVDLDAGRWSRRVVVAGKERTVALSIPAILADEKLPGIARTMRDPQVPFDPRIMEREMAKVTRMLHEEGLSVDALNLRLAQTRGDLPEPDPRNDRERAQALYYDALEAEGRLRVKRAREALRLWPDCADALVLLGEATPDVTHARAYFEQALAAAERELGPDALTAHRGHFWGLLETRPYMRARRALADLQWNQGEFDSAIAHWTVMLELNPNDNQGVRLLLIPRLLELGRIAEAREVIGRFPEDGGTVMRHAGALATFRLRGAGDEATSALALAVRGNPHVVKYLLDPSRLPESLPSSYRLGSEEEAIIAADLLVDAWRAAPEAIEWLKAWRRDTKKVREKTRKNRR
ncbi:MAG: tetratricopeptide repeat protein [Candidatus Eiseniibacteriota bacterium]